MSVIRVYYCQDYGGTRTVLLIESSDLEKIEQILEQEGFTFQKVNKI
jgi:hypothetical protein